MTDPSPPAEPPPDQPRAPVADPAGGEARPAARTLAGSLPWLPAPFLIGSLLRLYQITTQIIADDEWHALWAALFQPYGFILTHLGKFDHSIPLALLDRLLIQTVGLSEMLMRLPVLLFGIGGLLLLPLLARSWVSPLTATVFAWLLAIAPLHVYFSRYARPYVLGMTLTFVAVAAFDRWWTGGRRGWLSVYAASAVFASWLHLSSAPAALSPLFCGAILLLAALATARFTASRWSRALWWRQLTAFAAGDGLRRGARGWMLAACLAALGLAVTIGVPLALNSADLLGKAGRGSITWPALRETAKLFSGVGDGRAAAAFAFAALWGVLSLGRRNLRLTLAIATLALAQMAALMVMRPQRVETPIILARYLGPLFPFFLLLAAEGLAAAGGALNRLTARMPAWSPAAIACGLLLWAGPLKATYYYPNAWTNHGFFQYAYSPDGRFSRRRPKSFSAFYERLRASPPGSLLIVEAPWRLRWRGNVLPLYQRYHRQRMMVGFTAPRTSEEHKGELGPGQRGISLRNAVHVADEARLSALGVDYVVFHKSRRPARLRQVPAVEPWIELYRRRYGPPVHEDRTLAAFALKRGG